MKKRTLLIALLCLISLFSFAQAQSRTSGDFTYVVLEDGTAEITDCTAVGMVLEIPSQLDGYTVTSIARNALGFRIEPPNSTVNSHHYPRSVIIFPDTVKNIAAGNLNYFLVRVALPDGVVLEQISSPLYTDGMLFKPLVSAPEDADLINTLTEEFDWPRTSEPLNLRVGGDFCFQLHENGTAELLAMDRQLDHNEEPLHVVIPAEVEGYPVTAIGANAFPG